MQRQASIAVVCANQPMSQEVAHRLTQEAPTELTLIDDQVRNSYVTTTHFIEAAPNAFADPAQGAYVCWGANAQILVIDSSAGIDATTISLARAAMHFHPTLIAISGLNEPNSNFDETVAVVQRVFGDDRRLVPVSLPVLNDLEVVQGTLNLLSNSIIWNSQSGSVEIHEMDPEHYELIGNRIDELLDAIAISSSNPEIVSSIISGDGIDSDSIIDELIDATIRLDVVPVMALEGGIGAESIAQIAQRIGLPDKSTWSPIRYSGQEGLIATLLPNQLLRVWQGSLNAGAYRYGSQTVHITQLATMSGLPVSIIEEPQLCQVTINTELPVGSTISTDGYEIHIAVEDQ